MLKYLEEAGGAAHTSCAVVTVAAENYGYVSKPKEISFQTADFHAS